MEKRRERGDAEDAESLKLDANTSFRQFTHQQFHLQSGSSLRRLYC